MKRAGFRKIGFFYLASLCKKLELEMNDIYKEPRSKLIDSEENDLHGGNSSPIKTYSRYWQRGWWVFLMIFLVNLTSVLLVFPLAFIFKGETTYYWVSAGIAYVFLGIPLSGWLFEVFSRNSKRL